MINNVLVALFLDLIVLGSFMALGLVIVKGIAPSLTRMECFALAYPVGSGIYSFSLFLFGWLGLRINKISTIVVYGLLFLLGIGYLYLNSHRSIFQESVNTEKQLSVQDFPTSEKVIWAVFGLFIVIAFLLSVGRSYSAYDAASEWAVEGYGIALEGSIWAGKTWGMWGISYPLNTKLQVATFKLFGNELLPGSKLLYPTYLLALCLGIYHFWISNHIPKSLAGLGMLFIITNPVMFTHATNGHVNVAFTTSFVLGAIQLIQGIIKQSKGRHILGGVLLAIAAWTRPEGIGFSVATVVILLAISRLNRQRFHFTNSAIPIAVSALWMLFAWNGVSGGQLGNAVRSMLSGISRGDLNLQQLYLIPRIFIERAILPENWGAFLPVVFTLIIIALIANDSWSFSVNWYLLGVVLLTCIIPLGIYYAVSYEPFDDKFIQVLRRDFDRAFLPAFTMLTVYAFNLWGRFKSNTPK